MENVYSNAYTEIYEILGYMPINYIKKIPNELLILFEQKRNKEYIYCVNTEKKISEQDMLVETKSILEILYRDFWATPEKKETILEKEKLERDLYQIELRKKYNPDNIFPNNNQLKQKTSDNSHNIKSIDSNLSLIEYKESIFKKIINKIKSILFLL